MKRSPPPFKTKMIERIRLPDPEERERHLVAAGYNLFLVPAAAVFIDLFTDSGTSAMSDHQWAALMHGDESYAGARSYFRLEAAVQEIFGFPHMVPTHQGRMAESLLFSLLVSPGSLVPGNGHFDTTRANIEAAGGHALDLGIAEARDPDADHPFKGNIDLDRLRRALKATPRERIPLVMITITNNSGGGQPVALANVRAAAELCHQHGIPLWIDACRHAENAWLIRQREPGQEGRSVAEIVRELFSYADGCTMSAKKDGLANIGGFLASRDPDLMARVRERMVIVEGFPTYGGLAGRDLEAVAVGLGEALDEEYLAHRAGQVAAFGDALTATGVPVMRPIGGHAVYIDARRFLPAMPRIRFPAQALVVALYRAGAVRGVEIGSVMFGSTDAATGDPLFAPLELVRLAVPRRVYSDAHLEYVVDVMGEISASRDHLRGLEIVHEAPVLRHFTARFREVA